MRNTRVIEMKTVTSIKGPEKIAGVSPSTRGLINRKENSLSYTLEFCFRFASRI